MHAEHLGSYLARFHMGPPTRSHWTRSPRFIEASTRGYQLHASAPLQAAEETAAYLAAHPATIEELAPL